MRLTGTRLGAWSAVAAIAVISSGCAIAPPPPPTALPADEVGVGSVVPCDSAAMRPHCDAWIAAARELAPVPAAEVVSATVHVGWSLVPPTTSVRVVVALGLRHGSTWYQPIVCGEGADPGHVCDFAGVSLPPK